MSALSYEVVILASRMDKYIVSARKYRPARFEDVVGQASITTTLRNAILKGQLGHAYLFSGPRGVGKTTCARIFAKTINCATPLENGEACDTCESCVSFKENRSYSIHELDAASNNSVEDIRTLTEQVRIPPQTGSYSIYIIDEVHMLSQSAFNAFLKTLEEPPSHAVFILATTEKHKIIPTILSRCQVYDFNRIRVEDAVGFLKEIAGKESVQFEEDALHMVALKADGAMRDALSIFDQVVNFSGGKITYHGVIENLNILDYEYYFRLMDHLLDADVPSSFLLLNDVLLNGFDGRNFMNGFAAHLRDLLVCRDPGTIPLMEVGASFRNRYLEQSKKVPLEFLYEGLEICNQADIQYRTSRNQRLTIELALVRLASLSASSKKKVKGDQDRVQETEDQATLNGGIAAHLPEDEPETGEGPGGNRVVRKSTISIRDSIKGGEQDNEVPPAGEPGVSEEREVDPEKVLLAWNSYADSLKEKKPRIYSTLKGHLPEVQPDGTVRVRLSSESQKDNFEKNIRGGLVSHIGRQTGTSGLQIITEVAVPGEKDRKIYTDQDKLDYLMKKNPDLGLLKTRFNLDFDQ